jgi:RNA polymerase sigma factor (sigma-70 family)
MPTLQTVLRQLRTSSLLYNADLPDGQLLEQFLVRRDESAFEGIVRRHGPMVLGVCQRLLRNVQDAEDAFQATFIILARKAQSIVPRDNLANWLYGVAYRTGLKARATTARRRMSERQVTEMPEAEVVEQDLWTDLEPLLDQELSRLPDKYRLPIVLCDLEGKTRKEAARQLDWAEGTVASRLARGRSFLADRLKRHGLTLSGGLLAVVVAEHAAANCMPRLVAATVRAALAGPAATAAISANVAALTEGVLRTMLLSKLKMPLVLLVASLLALGAGLFAHCMPAEAPPPGQAPKPGTARPANTTQFGSTRLRHGDSIFFVAYLSNGKQLVSAGLDHTLRLWDVGSGRELRRFEWPAARKDQPNELQEQIAKQLEKEMGKRGMAGGMLRLVEGGLSGGSFPVAVSPDGKYVAAHNRGTTYAWQTATGKRLLEHKAQGMFAGPLLNPSLTFSSDGKQLMVVTHGSVEAFDLATGKSAGQVGKTGPGNLLAPGGIVSPDGKYLVMEAFALQLQSSSLKVRDLKTGKELAELKVDIAGARELQFAPDGKTLVWASLYGAIQVYEIGKDRQPRTFGEGKGPVDQPTSLCFSPDGKTLATARSNRTIELWNMATGQLIRRLGEANRRSGPPAMVRVAVAAQGRKQTNLAFSPDGKTLAASQGDAVVHQFDVTTGKEVVPPDAGHVQAITALHLTPDGQTLTTAAAGEGIHVWAPRTGKQLQHLALPGIIALSANGKRAACITGSNVEVWDVQAGKRLEEISADQQRLVAVALSPDGKTVALRDADNAQVRLWHVGGKALGELSDEVVNPGKGEGVAFAEVTGVVTPDLAFSPDGKYVAGADAKHRLCLWDVSTRARLWEVALPGDQVVERFAYAPTGRMLAMLYHDGTISLYETATGAKRGQFGQARSRRPAGRLTVLFGGRAITDFQALEAGPQALAFSPSGRHLVASHGSPAIAVWDVLAGKEVGTLTGHQGAVTSLLFLAGGHRVVSGSVDTTARLWDVTARVKPAAPPGGNLEPRTLETLWANLGDRDAVKAFDALRKLSNYPQQMRALARSQVKPVPAPDARVVARLIDDLDSSEFEVRRKATADLEKLGDLIVPELTRALEGQRSLEARQRLQSVRKRLLRAGPPGTLVRDLRILELLELQGGPDARQFLQTLARGAPGARLTAEARSAVERMAAK